MVLDLFMIVEQAWKLLHAESSCMCCGQLRMLYDNTHWAALAKGFVPRVYTYHVLEGQ